MSKTTSIDDGRGGGKGVNTTVTITNVNTVDGQGYGMNTTMLTSTLSPHHGRNNDNTTVYVSTDGDRNGGALHGLNTTIDTTTPDWDGQGHGFNTTIDTTTPDWDGQGHGHFGGSNNTTIATTTDEMSLPFESTIPTTNDGDGYFFAGNNTTLLTTPADGVEFQQNVNDDLLAGCSNALECWWLWVLATVAFVITAVIVGALLYWRHQKHNRDILIYSKEPSHQAFNVMQRNIVGVPQLGKGGITIDAGPFTVVTGFGANDMSDESEGELDLDHEVSLQDLALAAPETQRMIAEFSGAIDSFNV